VRADGTPLPVKLKLDAMLDRLSNWVATPSIHVILNKVKDHFHTLHI
jgi:hypothetical protein